MTGVCHEHRDQLRGSLRIGLSQLDDQSRCRSLQTHHLLRSRRIRRVLGEKTENH